MSFNRQQLVYPLRARSEIYIPISDSSMREYLSLSPPFFLCSLTSCTTLVDFESVSQIGANSAAIISGEERNRIREYVEEIVAEMLGGNLDTIRVGQLSRSENCK